MLPKLLPVFSPPDHYWLLLIPLSSVFCQHELTHWAGGREKVKLLVPSTELCHRFQACDYHIISLLAILLSWASDHSLSSSFFFYLIRKMLVSTAFIHCTEGHCISVLLINFVSFHFSNSCQAGAMFFSCCLWSQPSKTCVFVFLDRSWIAMGSMQLSHWPFCLYFYIFFILSQMESFSCRVSCFQHSEIEQLLRVLIKFSHFINAVINFVIQLHLLTMRVQ